MTNIDLKTQIDNAITNKTAASSITPTDVGNNCKAIVDYVDQQDLLLVNLTGSQSITGSKTFTNTLADPAIIVNSNQPSVFGMRIANSGGSDGLFLDNISGTGIHAVNADLSAPSIFLDNLATGAGLVIFTIDGDGIDMTCSGTGYGIRMESSDQIGFDLTMNGNGGGINIANNGGTGKALTITNSNSVSGDIFVYKKNVTTRLAINDAGTILSQGFIKEGGTSAQFLMADGSVTTSVTDTNAVHKTGDESITGTKTFNTTGFSSAIEVTSTGLADAVFVNNLSNGNGVTVYSNGTGDAINVTNNSTGDGLQITNSSTGKGIKIFNDSNGDGISIDNNGTLGSAIVVTQSATSDAGIVVTSDNGGVGIEVVNTNGNDGIIANQSPSSTGFNYVGQNNAVNTFTVNKTGTVRGESFNINALNTAPATASSTGTTGEIRWVNGFVYLCVATNTWQRAALATF